MVRLLPRSAARLLVGALIALQGLVVAPVPVGRRRYRLRHRPRRQGRFRRPEELRPVRRREHADDAQHHGPDRNDRTAGDPAPAPEPRPRAERSGEATGFERQGASVRGWVGGLNQLGAGPYRLVGTTTLDEALCTSRRRRSATTGKPVGLLVWRGRHAWVMSGFRATADPLATDDFDVTAAIVMDPLYPHGSTVWGPSPKPREALSAESRRPPVRPPPPGIDGPAAPASARRSWRRCPGSTSSSCRTRSPRSTGIRAARRLTAACPIASPLILDVDTGIDDSLALLYAAASPDAELVAVTCVAGNVDARQVAAEHARRPRAGRPRRRRGRARREVPLVRPLETTPETHGPRGLGYAELPPAAPRCRNATPSTC